MHELLCIVHMYVYVCGTGFVYAMQPEMYIQVSYTVHAVCSDLKDIPI